MKKHIKITAAALAVLILTVCFTVSFNAATIYEKDGFLYSYTASTKADLYGRNINEPDLVIPKEFNDHYVTNIVDSAFNSDNNIQTLSFSKATLLERIGYYCFYNCQNLSGTVYIAGRINEVGVSAFQNCISLESVIYRSNLISIINAQSFYHCTSLSSVELPDYLQRIEKLAFADCPSLEKLIIPKTVSYIDPTAFDGCNDLTIYCYTDSYAHQFAEENGIDYVLLDAPAPTEPPTEPETEPVTEPATEPETVPVTEPATELLGYILGDVDNNGAVESIDATWIQRYSVQMELPIPEENMAQGDVDGDGETNIYDVTFIQRYVVDIPTPYPIGEFITK